MSASDDAAALIVSAPCNTVLPAGAGKTELLAHACGQLAVAERRTLFLTHTNAGVEVFRQRMRRLGLDSSMADIRTIASWCESWCRNYPTLAAIDRETDGTNDFECYTVGATRVLAALSIQRALRASWQVAMVDEYQDCTIAQHAAICLLADAIPTIVVGDPLQSVFEFNEVVSWNEHVDKRFDRLQLPWSPHRWTKSNPELGEDLLAVRKRLEMGGTIDLTQLQSVRWVPYSDQRVPAEIRRTVGATGSSVVIRKYRKQCVKTAKSGDGKLEAIEDLNRSDLAGWATEMDNAEPPDRILLVAKQIRECMARLPPGLPKRIDDLEAKRDIRFQQNSVLGPFTAAAVEARAMGNATSLGRAVDAASEFPNVVIARREHWADLRSTIRAARDSPEKSFAELANAVRGRSRRSALTSPDAGIVATPLLVKGLEFDSVLVLGAEQLTAPELYVAMTRACVSLTVMSPSSTLVPNGAPLTSVPPADKLAGVSSAQSV